MRVVMTAQILSLGFTSLDHPLYSPDFARSDFHLISKLKEHFRKHHFLSDNEMKAAVKCGYVNDMHIYALINAYKIT